MAILFLKIRFKKYEKKPDKLFQRIFKPIICSINWRCQIHAKNNVLYCINKSRIFLRISLIHSLLLFDQNNDTSKSKCVNYNIC